ncbi:MAG: cell division protein FtsQ/DivIB [Solirubrobacterales bacterium]|nr:cell division protein FtsQ/DivIB [Solirubrobacterales bacterium]
MAARASRLTRRPSLALPKWSRIRNRLIVVVLVLGALLAGYMLWFRDSSLVEIEDVKVTGTGIGPGVEEQLAAAATGLSTLHLDRAAIEGAVADDPSVVALKIDTDFPHGVTIDVQSRPPAGWVDAEGGTLLAGDGTVLATGVEQPDGMPEIAGGDADGSRAEGRELAAARVIGAVPAPLAPQVEKLAVDDQHGVVARLNGGIELRFGAPGNADQKWRAAAAVLADPKLTSATYIDLSVPSRPVVG